MKNYLLAYGCAMLLLASCTSPSGETKAPGQIDIVGKIKNPTELKASDFLKEINYIALETTDSCLINNNPDIQVYKNNIIVSTNKQCLVFDKTNGKFIRSIGHVGNDPGGYSEATFWIDDVAEELYFVGWNGSLMRYDLKGNYLGEVKVSKSLGPRNPACFVFTDSLIISYQSDLFPIKGTEKKPPFLLLDKKGEILDSIPSLLPVIPVAINTIRINILKNEKAREFYGNMGIYGMIIAYFNSDEVIESPRMLSTLWKHDGKVRFKEAYLDTIYTLSGNKSHPYLVFNTGKYHYPVEERYQKKKNDERIKIDHVMESASIIIFQFRQRDEVYTGIYNKNTQTTQVSKGQSFMNDIDNFMPLNPRRCNADNEYADLIQASSVLEWMEEHPEIKPNGKFAFAKEINEESNPVVILMK
ncbi:hypothetical protein AE938_08210 [Bacteroides fragilis]|uniref:DUF4934 domain-containing protein n=1 Tax=Bacteroides fragilis TaxID=817 RepID=UPI001CA86146|nr:DUF4934 domain-containing protein [Bacteroides fragilis]MBY2898844.1 hypothetical protein [Bacteroides fragilis]